MVKQQEAEDRRKWIVPTREESKQWGSPTINIEVGAVDSKRFDS